MYCLEILDSFFNYQITVHGFAMVGEIEAEKFNLLIIINQGTNVCFSTKAPLLQNRCYVQLNFKICHIHLH